MITLGIVGVALPPQDLAPAVRAVARARGWSVVVGTPDQLSPAVDVIVGLEEDLPAVPQTGRPLIVVVPATGAYLGGSTGAGETAAAVVIRENLTAQLGPACDAVIAGLRVWPMEYGARGPEHRSDGTLSTAETAVYRALARGLSNREIGEALDISVNTVKYHLARIYAKLGVRNRTEAVRSRDDRRSGGFA